MNETLSWILDLVQDVDPVVRTVLAGVAILLETSVLVGLIMPGDTVVIVASTAVEGPAQFVALVVAVVLGALVGETIGFGLGRFFGPRIRDSRLGRKIGRDHWMRAEHYLDRRGGIAVFISRFLPVLHSLIPLTVGMSTMSYRRFISWTIPACLLWAVMYVSVGSAAAGTYRELADQLHYAGYIFVGIIAVFLVLIYTVKRLLHRREARHMSRAAESDAKTADEDRMP